MKKILILIAVISSLTAVAQKPTIKLKKEILRSDTVELNVITSPRNRAVRTVKIDQYSDSTVIFTVRNTEYKTALPYDTSLGLVFRVKGETFFIKTLIFNQETQTLWLMRK